MYVSGSVEAEFGEGIEQEVMDALLDQGYFAIHRSQWTGANNSAAMMKGVNGAKFILPDIEAGRSGYSSLVDAKAKTNANYFRNRGRFEHGIEINPLYGYLRTAYERGMPLAIILYDKSQDKWLITNPDEMFVEGVFEGGFSIVSYEENDSAMARGMGSYSSVLNIPITSFVEIDINNVELKEHSSMVRWLDNKGV